MGKETKAFVYVNDDAGAAKDNVIRLHATSLSTGLSVEEAEDVIASLTKAVKEIKSYQTTYSIVMEVSIPGLPMDTEGDDMKEIASLLADSARFIIADTTGASDVVIYPKVKGISIKSVATDTGAVAPTPPAKPLLQVQYDSNTNNLDVLSEDGDFLLSIPAQLVLGATSPYHLNGEELAGQVRNYMARFISEYFE